MNRAHVSSLVAILATTVVIALSTTSAQAAIPRDGSPAAITASVMSSSNPEASFRRLSTADRATFLAGFAHQVSVTVVERSGRYSPSSAERAAMRTSGEPAALTVGVTAAASGCWYRYWYESWYDLGLHDGDSWLQLNWCSSNSRITSWSQSNYGCAGHYGATCSTGGRADLNVGWEVRSTRYFNANFFGYGNTFCMQIRGGATGLYSENSSSSGSCPLS